MAAQVVRLLCLAAVWRASAAECSASPLDFANAVLQHNNLGGEGPDTGDEEMLFHNLGELADGRQIGLKVTAMEPPEYEVQQPSPNRVEDQMGIINVEENSTVHLKFEFVDAADDTPMCLGPAGMTFFDVDGRIKITNDNMEYDSQEVLAICGATRTIQSDCYDPDDIPTQLEVVPDADSLFGDDFPDDCQAWKAKSPPEVSLPELDDPNDLTDAQLAHTISYTWDNLCEFDAFFANTGRGSQTVDGNGRPFFFAGLAAQTGVCPTCTATCNICNDGDTCLDAVSCVLDEIASSDGSNNPELISPEESCDAAQATVKEKCPQCASQCTEDQCLVCPAEEDVVSRYEVDVMRVDGALVKRNPPATAPLAALLSLAAMSGLAAAVAGVCRRNSAAGSEEQPLTSGLD